MKLPIFELAMASMIALSLFGCANKTPPVRNVTTNPAQLFIARCSHCHSLERVLEKTDYTADHWRDLVDLMMASDEANDVISSDEAQRIKMFLTHKAWRQMVSAQKGSR